MAKHTDDKHDEVPSGSNRGELPLHPLVVKLVSDPDNPPEIVLLTGYLGAAGKGKDAYYRIYLDSDFRTYYELLRSDVLHAEEADPSQAENPTKIFIKATAKFTLVQVVEASFLQGDITSTYPVGGPCFLCFPPTAYFGGHCSGQPHTGFACPGGHPHTGRPCPSGQPHTHRCPASHPNTFGCSVPGGGTAHTPGYCLPAPGAQINPCAVGSHPHTPNV
jgi:hypothetical protein